MSRDVITLFGVNIDKVDLQGLIRHADASVRTDKRAKIMYVNIHVMNLAFKDRELRKALSHADMVYCDGEGVRFGARILGKALPQRMTGADWIWDLCAMCERRGYSIYLLGGIPGIAEKAGGVLSKRYPGLKMAGTHHGFFPKVGDENEKVISSINKKAPHVLLVGFGSPLQEIWIHQNFEKLQAAAVWAVGAVADFVSGEMPRGPRWMLDYGLEWLFRLSIEPKKMWKRYLFGNFVFFERIMRDRLLKRIVRPRAD